jgi:chromate transporter
MERNIKLLFELFVSFFRISPVTFGGGYAMIPLIEEEVLRKRKWMKEEELKETFAMCESVPGAVGINSAILVGWRVAGVSGSIVALAGVTLPAFLIALGLVLVFFAIRHETWLEGALVGIRAAVVALIIYAGFHMGKGAMKDWKSWVWMVGSFLALAVLKVSPVFVLLAGAFAGGVCTMILGKRSDRQKKQDYGKHPGMDGTVEKRSA